MLRSTLFVCVVALLPGILALSPWMTDIAFAQEPAAGSGLAGPDAGLSQAELQQLAAEATRERSIAAPDPDNLRKGNIDFLSLLIDGGIFMIPIAAMSLLVVAVSLERLVALRRGRIFPRVLRRELKMAIEETEGVLPQPLFETSERYPSAASRILRDVLQKVGRPTWELDAAINDGAQREADYLYGNVRWLTLAAAVTPLIGLLGTVWGMIIAFYNTTQLGAGSNKAESLAEGIYVALVTTLGGLAVAIPAAIFAHYFEGKITKSLAAVELELRRLVPRFESLEGVARFDISSRGMTRRVAVGISKRRSGSAEVHETPPPPVRPPVKRS